MWGQMLEDHATQQYIEKTGNDVEKAGPCLFPCGYLRSTPDGTINSTKVPDKEVSGGSSVSQNNLPQLILGYIYILKYLQSNFIG